MTIIRALYRDDLTEVVEIENAANLVEDEDFETKSVRPLALTREDFIQAGLDESLRLHLAKDENGETVGYLIFERAGDHFLIRKLVANNDIAREQLFDKVAELAEMRLRKTSLRAVVPDYDRRGMEYWKGKGFGRSWVVRGYYEGDVDAVMFEKVASA